MASTHPKQPLFKSLERALSFIESHLDNDNAAELFDACLESRASEFLRPLIFERLREIHTEIGLRTLYLDCSPPLSFPADAETFKLGGHDRELGHIHIDFKKVKSKWQLEAIWMCR